MPVSTAQILDPVSGRVTQRIQGKDGVLSYSFEAGTDGKLMRQTERVLLRLDAELDLDLQHELSQPSAEVNVRQFDSVAGVDPVTGRPTTNVGKASPNEYNWEIFWADNPTFPAIEVIVHEWGHVLGLGHPDRDNPLSTASNTAETVMSYNRNDSFPGRFYSKTDLEALTILWGKESSAAAERTPFSTGATTSEKPSSLAFELQQSIEAETSNQAFVVSAYETLLERPADFGGAQSWEHALEQGLSRRGMIDQILLSDEMLGLLQTAV